MNKLATHLRIGHLPTLFLAGVLLVAGCAPSHQKVQLQKQLYAKTSHTLQQGGPGLQNAYYACLMNGLAQGLPLTQVSDDCATKLTAPDGSKPGAGGVGGGGITLPNGGSPFDPASVSANCASGDPRRGQTNSEKPVGYPASSIPGKGWTKVGGMEGFGYGTYGGKGMKDEDGKEYIGLSKEESVKQKDEAIKAALKALEEYQDLRSRADKETDPAKKAELEKQAKEADKKWREAHDEASKDPNKKEPGFPNSRTAGESSACEMALQSARETLYECNRNGWKTQTCQSLQAKMNHCPDPALIYVDPDAGYSCGQAMDAEAVKDAWVQRCQEIVKYGPGGDNPCQPPKVAGNGRFVDGSGKDICLNPKAMVNPDSGVCVATLEVSKFGQTDINQVIVLALDKIGGPIVVLPHTPRPPSPRPGPEPRPGPR